MAQKYKAISLFSGLGGDTLGLTNANVEVVAYNELDKTFCKSHEENFPNSELITIKTSELITRKTANKEKSIYDDPEMLAVAIASADALHVTDAMFQNDPANVGEHHIPTPTHNIPTPTHNDDRNIQNIPDEVFEKYKNDVDIIFAGFPCQGFSAAGKKMDNDPRNTLFREFLRTAKIINPKMIIGENVKGLLSRKTTSGENYIDVIVKEFENIGYNVEYRVLKAHQYGVPQKRERLIIIGTKNDNPYGWTSNFPEPLNDGKNNLPNLKNIIKYDMTGTIRVDPNLFSEIPEECIIKNMRDKKKYEDNNGAHPYLKRLYYADENLRTYKDKTHDNLFSFGKRDSPIHGEIIDIRNPAKTIICTYDHQPRFFVPIKNKSGTYLRTILPHELKQIQGFPENYKMIGNNKQQIVQVGNAVPPPLIERIVRNIIE